VRQGALISLASRHVPHANTPPTPSHSFLPRNHPIQFVPHLLPYFALEFSPTALLPDSPFIGRISIDIIDTLLQRVIAARGGCSTDSKAAEDYTLSPASKEWPRPGEMTVRASTTCRVYARSKRRPSQSHGIYTHTRCMYRCILYYPPSTPRGHTSPPP
jgi:hypothetical protein